MKHISLPYKCILPLVKQPEMLKAFVLWGKLKLIAKNGAIHNIRSKKQILAKKFGMSENTFRKYLSLLKSKYMVWEDESGILRIANKYSIYEALNITPNYSQTTGLVKDKKFKLKKEELHLDNIKLLALQYHKTILNHNNLKRVQDQLLKPYGTIVCPKIQKKIKSSVTKKANNLIEQSKNPAVGYRNDNVIGFVDDNVSSNTIAKMFGRKSKMTGNRFMTKLKEANVIEYEQRHIILEPITRFVNISLIQETQTLPVVIIKQDGVHFLALRVPNSWKKLSMVGLDKKGNWTYI
jgi:IS1 family transposase